MENSQIFTYFIKKLNEIWKTFHPYRYPSNDLNRNNVLIKGVVQ